MCIFFKEKIVIKYDSVINSPRVRIYKNTEKKDATINAENWIKEYGHIVIEEYIYGNEIAIRTFTDGKNWIHSPIFKNHKRIVENDLGENISGIGTYSGKKCFLI